MATMSTQFTPLASIASGIVQRIKDGAAAQFKLITYAQATNGAQIWDLLQGMSSIPGCVVAIGSGEYGPNMLTRTVRVMIVVVSKFSRGAAADADGIWSKVESVLELFLPDENTACAEICGIVFAPVSWQVLESEENVSAYMLTLEGTEFLSKV